MPTGVPPGVSVQGASLWPTVAGFNALAYRANNAVDATPPPADGETVAEWENEGTLGSYLLDTVTGAPTWEENYFNPGYHGVDFPSRTNIFIESNSLTFTLDTSANGGTLWFIGSVDASMASGDPMGMKLGEASNFRCGFESNGGDANGTTIRWRMGNTVNQTSTETLDVANTANLCIVYAVAQGGTAADGWCEINGVVDSTLTAPTVFPSTDYNEAMMQSNSVWGSAGESTTHAAGFMLGEMTTAQKAILESYATAVGVPGL